MFLEDVVCLEFLIVFHKMVLLGPEVSQHYWMLLIIELFHILLGDNFWDVNIRNLAFR